MHVFGWILWTLAALWGLIELRLFLHTCLGRSLRDYAYLHEWRQRLASSGFALALIASGLFLTAFFDFSKLHLLWIVPLGTLGGFLLGSLLFPDPAGKALQEGLEQLRKTIPDHSD